MGYKLSDLKKMSNLDITEYLTPKYVYIPLASGRDENVTTFVKKGDYVAIGTVLGKRKGANKVPIHSSVSGHVVGIVKKIYVTGEMVRCVKIDILRSAVRFENPYNPHAKKSCSSKTSVVPSSKTIRSSV